MSVIVCDHLTKDYGHGKGIFDVSLTVAAGEVYGYIGPNGAGKSTTMRHLMGFCHAQSGSATIEGRDCWREARAVHARLGYLPGMHRVSGRYDRSGVSQTHRQNAEDA